MDEIGVPLDPRPPKVLAARGQKKVQYCNGLKRLQSRERQDFWQGNKATNNKEQERQKT